VSAEPPAGAITVGVLGCPRMHLRRTDSTNERARALAIAGAPHGTLVTASEQTAGRGRQGRGWVAPADSALLCSLVLRNPPALLSLIAGVAVCDAVERGARVKWPNDIVVERGATGESPPAALPAPRGATTSQAAPASRRGLAKLAGILVEGRPQEGWAVLGIGLNVAVRIEDLPEEVRAGAASLELPTSAIEPITARVLGELERRLGEPARSVLEAWRERDALFGREVAWAGGEGRAHGVDDAGRLIVRLADGALVTLDAGEVHLGRA
jgi:BirA family transcriptional regulator, biotin operon repressor / biotin---[acetyl-CoA-carboxylase] ligase